MTGFIFKVFYSLPLHNIIGFMALFIVVWLSLDRIFRKNVSSKTLWKAGNGIMFVGMLAVIVVITIASRSEGTEVILTPFHSFIEARVQPEMYRSMLMNVFMFFPLGLTLPYALPEKWKCRALIAILFALVFSVMIEYSQYYFSLGRAETDDVLCNTLGCAIGTLAFKRDNVLDKKIIARYN